MECPEIDRGKQQGWPLFIGVACLCAIGQHRAALGHHRIRRMALSVQKLHVVAI
jgi:hypothetical protein